MGIGQMLSENRAGNNRTFAINFALLFLYAGYLQVLIGIVWEGKGSVLSNELAAQPGLEPGTK